MRSCPDTDIDPVFFGVNVPARAVSHGNSSPGKAWKIVLITQTETRGSARRVRHIETKLYKKEHVAR